MVQVKKVKALTHEELYKALIDSVLTLTNAIEAKNKELKDTHDYDERTQLFKTAVIIRRWFNDQGNLLL